MSTEQAVRTALESLGIYERIEKVENRQTFIAKRLHTEDVLKMGIATLNKPDSYCSLHSIEDTYHKEDKPTDEVIKDIKEWVGIINRRTKENDIHINKLEERIEKLESFHSTENQPQNEGVNLDMGVVRRFINIEKRLGIHGKNIEQLKHLKFDLKLSQGFLNEYVKRYGKLDLSTERMEEDKPTRDSNFTYDKYGRIDLIEEDPHEKPKD